MRRLMLSSVLVLAITVFAVVRAQTTQSTDAERLAQTAKGLHMTPEQLAQTAKDFHATPEQLDRFVRRELGDPIVVDGDLIVGVHRDAAGHVTAVQITTSGRGVTFTRTPDKKHRALRYGNLDLSTETPKLAQAEDFDGDGRIDRMMLTPEGEELPHILLRIGTEFVQAQAVGDGIKFRTSDGRVFSFDVTKHEWITVN